MPSLSRPRRGSLQFYPRKRAKKALPSVNWKHIKAEQDSLLGFIAYKAAMASAVIKDNTEDSLTKNKRLTIPVTILEVPNMKVFAVRFYKDNKALKDVVISNDKELKRKLKVPKTIKELDKETPEGYDDIRVIVYSLPHQAKLKKTPDMIELAINAQDKLAFVKSLIGKEIALEDVLNTDLVDVRGLTKGKGTQGPVKRFGIGFKGHKSEKGRRNPGSIGPWHPAHVTFRTPMAGQMGYFTRVHNNFKVIDSGKIGEKDINSKSGFRHYGKINTSYIILNGSVQGPSKRQILVTFASRPSKKQAKKQYEFVEVLI